jgi:D-glycero-D-manno-heptose 1,7-bisphosphate phosphatase
MKVAVFIERDGVLNQVRMERQNQVSPATMEDFQVNREAVPLLKKLKAAGLLLMVTTNQPGLSRGYQSRRELDRMHELLRATFALDDIFVCPHDETDGCSCRRPKPGLLVEAGFKWRLSLDHCFGISDKWQDAEAARAVNCTSLLLQSPWNGTARRDLVLPDLAAVVDKLAPIADGQALAGRLNHPVQRRNAASCRLTIHGVRLSLEA